MDAGRSAEGHTNSDVTHVPKPTSPAITRAATMSDDLDMLRDSIAQAADAGSFVTRYAVMAEVIDPDGEHAVHMFTDCDLMYQVLGLLEHGKEVAKARFHGWDEDDE